MLLGRRAILGSDGEIEDSDGGSLDLMGSCASVDGEGVVVMTI